MATTSSTSTPSPRTGTKSAKAMSLPKYGIHPSTSSPKSSGKPRSNTMRANIEVADSSQDANKDADRLNHILSDLTIKFKNCTFTYKERHLQAVLDRQKKKNKSRYRQFTNKVKSTLERVGEGLGIEDSEFKSCIFVPKSEEEDVQLFVRKNFNDIKIKFESCRFMKRSSTVLEKVARRLRGIFGIVFELTYIGSGIGSIADVEEYTFRLKDISVITTYVQERIVEKG